MAMYERVLGAKLALFLGDRLVVLHRDDKPGLLWAGYWDLPGGGREGTETPLACVLRETHEEVSLRIDPEVISWGRVYGTSSMQLSWFFVGHAPDSLREQIVLGDEGKGWDLWSVDEFFEHALTVPNFKPRLQDFLAGVPSDPIDRS
jgi:8-oxo-dGTP diphosphatase